MKRLLTLLLCAAMVLSGCSAASENGAGYAYDMEYDSAETVAALDKELTSSTTAQATAATDRKLIRTVELDAETKEFDALLAGLNEKVTALGGYVENRQSGSNSYSGTHYCTMTIRIPADKLDAFLTHVSENANVTSSSESTEDVTLEYVDTEAKITALETEQARLLELLAEAQNLSEILQIEERLSDVTYELERYASRLRSYDNLVTYATVSLYLREVAELTPTEEPTVGQRISEGFTGSLHDLAEGITDLFVWIVVNSPYLVVMALILVPFLAVLRRNLRRRKAKNAPDPSDNA